jgi:hypothetical protein
MAIIEKIEWRVKPITRYIITRYMQPLPESSGDTRQVSGEYDNADTAFEVALALCKQDQERLGLTPGDDRIQYPIHPHQLPPDAVVPAKYDTRGEAA